MTYVLKNLDGIYILHYFKIMFFKSLQPGTENDCKSKVYVF